jgi:5-formyltetrahydrofolate cyclo-ligase
MKEKESLRKEYKKIRSKVQNKEDKSHLIFNTIKELEIYQKSRVIGIYNSFKDEVLTKEIIKYSLSKEKVVCIPKVISDSKMVFIKIDQGYNLDIREPEMEDTKIINPKEIELMIVPGICFDKNKNRVGFGKAYYDNYLKNTKSYNIGICFEEQILKNDLILTTPNDIVLDMVVTEEKLYS